MQRAGWVGMRYALRARAGPPSVSEAALTFQAHRQSRRLVSSHVLLGLVELIVIPQLFLCIGLKDSCKLLREMLVCQGANLELECSLHRDSRALPLLYTTSHDSRNMRRWHEEPR
jgi:hypothetical protein